MFRNKHNDNISIGFLQLFDELIQFIKEGVDAQPVAFYAEYGLVVKNTVAIMQCSRVIQRYNRFALFLQSCTPPAAQ